MPSPLFTQSGQVRDFIFPIAIVTQQREFVCYVGTGFFIGRRGYALTAAHVIRAIPPGSLASAMFASPLGGWRGFDISIVDVHPVEDVALFRVAGENWNSPFRLAMTREGASLDYQLWGYPLDAQIVDTTALSRPPAPDLVCFKGYIRRRISRPIAGLTGSAFFELSQPAYNGCSGGPIWFGGGPSRAWNVCGIYVGFLPVRDPKAPFTCVGYGLRVEAFREWAPVSLGRTIAEEASESPLGIVEGPGPS